MSATETKDMTDTILQNQVASHPDSDLDSNLDSSIPSGGRALANLLLMEHDFRRARYTREIANILATRLDGFTHCDGVIVWVKKNKGSDIVMSRLEGGQLKTIKDKNLEKWAKKLSTWMDKTNAPAGELDTETILQRFLTFGRIYFRLRDCMYPLIVRQRSCRCVLLMRSQPWGEAKKFMLQQLAKRRVIV